MGVFLLGETFFMCPGFYSKCFLSPEQQSPVSRESLSAPQCGEEKQIPWKIQGIFRLLALLPRPPALGPVGASGLDPG